jgi:CheY-like chemotaxis protein
MYFIYVSTDVEAIGLLEEVLQRVDKSKMLLAMANGYDLIHFLQNVKRGESFPELIILSDKKSRLNGKELLELLKTDDIYRLIPVVLLLAGDDEIDEHTYRRLGADIIPVPSIPKDWVAAAKKMCAACN